MVDNKFLISNHLLNNMINNLTRFVDHLQLLIKKIIKVSVNNNNLDDPEIVHCSAGTLKRSLGSTFVHSTSTRPNCESIRVC